MSDLTPERLAELKAGLTTLNSMPFSDSWRNQLDATLYRLLKAAPALIKAAEERDELRISVAKWKQMSVDAHAIYDEEAQRLRALLVRAGEALAESHNEMQNALEFARLVINAANGDRLYTEGNIAAKDLLAATARLAALAADIRRATQTDRDEPK